MKSKGLIFIGMGFELLGVVLAGLYIGQKMDGIYGWNGLGVAGMVFLATGGWIYHLIVLLKPFIKDQPKSEESP